MPPRSVGLLSKNTPGQPFICPTCRLRNTTRLRRRFASSTTSSAKSLRYAQLTNRALIRLSGPDAASFLHNIIPAKILGVGTNPIYTAFLSAHGRILSDVFIYPPSWDGDAKHEWFIELDRESAGELMKHLKKHKLRAKFRLERVDAGDQAGGVGLGLVYQWPGLERPEEMAGVRAGGQDPRPGMGVRMIVDEGSKAELLQRLDDQGGQEEGVENYAIHRMMNGLAEGQDEIIPGSALPQESNIDFFGGIDFHKGCYLGQELTIRTHHTGVVRKRILPVQIYDEDNPIPDSQTAPEYVPGLSLPLPPSGSNLSKLSTRKGRSTGRWLGGVGNIGLALCRLEMMTNVQLTADTTSYDPAAEYRVQWDNTPGAEVRIKPFVPNWVREGIEQSLRRKDKKPKRREEEEDEDLD